MNKELKLSELDENTRELFTSFRCAFEYVQKRLEHSDIPEDKRMILEYDSIWYNDEDMLKFCNFGCGVKGDFVIYAQFKDKSVNFAASREKLKVLLDRFLNDSGVKNEKFYEGAKVIESNVISIAKDPKKGEVDPRHNLCFVFKKIFDEDI